jgi:hypothetical protein
VIILRIIVSFIFMTVGILFSFDLLEKAFTTADIIKVDGVLNIWGSYGSSLIGSYSLLYWLNKIVAFPFSLGDFNKVGIILVIIIAPLLTIGTYAKIHANISGYVECHNLRKLSSRYSSRTYAISEELCHKLSKKH